MCNAEKIVNEEVMGKVAGGIDQQPTTKTHEPCPLCGMEVWYTKDMTMEIHQNSNICKMGRKK